MAGYVKIWTCIHQDEWFLGLSLIERGMWYELLVLAKQVGDTGNIFVAKMRELSEKVGADVRTCNKIVAKMHGDGKIVLKKLPNSVIHIQIVNYLKWQELNDPKEIRNEHIRKTKMSQKCDKNPPTEPIPIPNQTVTVGESGKPDPVYTKKTIAEKFVELYTKYLVVPGYAREVKELSEIRITHICNRFKEKPDWDKWEMFFRDYIPQSKWLRGEVPPTNNRPQFKIDIDWLTRQSTIIQIREGKYHGK